MTLLEVRGLTKRFKVRGRGKAPFIAVNNVSFDLGAGETLGLVGETGAGKSTTGRLVLRLIEPDDGTITFEGEDLRALGPEPLRAARKRMQMVFQDPFGCLDPRVRVGDSVAEPLVIHYDIDKDERTERTMAALARVGLGPQTYRLFPHELSGGQLQRIAIARSLTLDPAFIVCDEPVAALDASVRAQVLNLLSDLQSELGIAYLFISHDLAIVEMFADRVAVMKDGEILEIGTTDEIFQNPKTDYTRTLIEAIPSLTDRARRRHSQVKGAT